MMVEFVLTGGPQARDDASMRIPVTQMSNEAMLRQLLDAIPSYVFLVDRDVTILDYNAAAGAFLGLGGAASFANAGAKCSIACIRGMSPPGADADRFAGVVPFEERSTRPSRARSASGARSAWNCAPGAKSKKCMSC